MGKDPSFQFYPSDWTRDLDDQPIEIEGAWIRICCRLWWSPTKGEATKTLQEWADVLRKTNKKTMKIFQILIEKGIASGSTLDNQNITIISRRMKRDWEIRQMRRVVGSLGGNPALKKNENNLDNQSANQKCPPSSSSSSSKKKEYSDEFISFYKNYPRKVAPDAAWKAWQKRNGERPPLEKILAVLEWQKKTEWKATDKKYIPHPATWINSGRWNDEVETKKEGSW